MLLSVICANVYQGFDHIAFMLRNLAAQTYRDFELIIVDAYYDQNATGIQDLSTQFGLKTVHVPAMEARHVGRWLHWELYSNALLLASGQWALYYGVHRYMHRRALEFIADRAVHNILTVLYQNNVMNDEPLPESFQAIEEAYGMSIYCEPWPYLSQTGFFCIPKDVMIHTFNGYNEALVFHHWADTDLSQRARHYKQMRVEVMSMALLRVSHPKDSATRTGIALPPAQAAFPLSRQPCSFDKNPSCITWLLQALRNDRHITVPVQRIVHDGFEWVRCEVCGCVGVEDEWAYIEQHLASAAYMRAPIGLAGIGRNLAALDADVRKLELTNKIDLIAASHDNPRYLQ